MPTDRALANTLPQIIWTCDADGQLEWVNDRWFELTGLTEAETLENKGALQAVHPDDLATIARHWSEALTSRCVTEFEYRIRDRAGEYRWHIARVAPVLGEDDEVTRWVAAVSDIHGRRAAEDALRASERKFDAFFYRNPIPLAVTRQSDGVFLLVNDAFVAMTGYTREEAIGRSSVELGMVPADVRAAAASHWLNASERTFELSVRRRDGRKMTVMLSNCAIELDGTPCFLNSGIDLTERRAMEDALREREAQARATQEALSRANQQKDAFLALLSHELRNPLTPILTSARVLERRVDAEGRRDIDVIVRQVKHLARLVDDLLDVSRVERGTVTLARSRVELANVVQRAVDATGPLFRERDHQLVIDVPERGLAVDGDAVRLTQIVDNLLANAARYTPPGGTVQVNGRHDGNALTLSVSDTGRGIEPALLPYVFEIFVQGARGPDRAEGGLGLGLALVRALTELHGGSVSAHSDGPGRGSEFTIRLPAATPRKARSAEQTDSGPSRAHAANTRVLVVDDHSDVADGLERLLRLMGYETRVALSPLDAIETAEAFRPQVALLDLGLPVMDGYELADRLREVLGDETPALIALSGYEQMHDRRRSREAGFVLHLAKPVDANDLVDAIDGVASR